MQTNQEVFDTLNGENIYKYSLTNANQVTLSCLSYGANWYELRVPTAAGSQNLILNFPKINDYITTNPYLNMSIGRTAGRIGAGKFKNWRARICCADQRKWQYLTWWRSWL
jgi:Galactose mutarotase and related enzymes